MSIKNLFSLCALTLTLSLAGCVMDMDEPLDLDETDVSLPADSDDGAEPDGLDMDKDTPAQSYFGPCSVTQHCSDGTAIGCAGEALCVSGTDGTGDYVQCDSNPKDYCPSAPLSPPVCSQYPDAIGTCSNSYSCGRKCEVETGYPGGVCVNGCCICLL
ncbi:MAG: hypothetical protein AAGC55_26665 [Myxococcota bacterium]